MYRDGKRIRAKVPKLPEARNPEGIFEIEKADKFKLLVIGESTVAGVGVATHKEGFAGTLGQELAKKIKHSISWKVYAKSGYTAKQVREALIPQVTEADADLIVIGLGGNDAFTLNTPFKWKREITRLINELQQRYPNTPVAFTNMPPIKEFPAFTRLIKFTIGNLVEILGETLSRLAAQRKNVYYNREKITIDEWTQRLNIDKHTAEFFSDGVHPSKLTYQVWAKDFANFLIREKVLSNSYISPN